MCFSLFSSFVLFLFLFFPFELQANEKQESPPVSQKIVIIASEDPIYSFAQETTDKYHFAEGTRQEYAGADFEIMQKLLEELGQTYEFRLVPFRQLEEQLKSGEADMALDLQKTPSLLKIAEFPRTPLRTQRYVFFGRAKEFKGTVMTYENVLEHNYTVGIQAGFIYPKEFWKAFPYQDYQLNNHLEEALSYEENVSNLVKKKIDLFIGNRDRAVEVVKKKGLDTEIIPYKNILYEKEFYCVYSKNSKKKGFQDLKALISRSLVRMEQSNKLKDINQYWIRRFVGNPTTK